MENNSLHKLGIDIGSTTVKIALLDADDNILFSDYERHFANIQETLESLIRKAYDKTGDLSVCPMITGSGGLTLAKHLEVPFVQEVIAVSTALTLCSTDRCGNRARWRGCQNHILRGRQRGTAYERHMCRRYRLIYRPDGFSHPDRRYRTK